ncbi:3-oxoacyl-[acyl-carrier-protein] reductase [Eubacterium uniforme]|uniref:3-oxoacyl-[acyl-carrier-protein] reductase n=1 Tax=Eubacterium uniforme TaxID=39495 RepID=A0A1T4VLE9_9FIRM|nr:3-oxoacyl-[acyl-carrier-protein] reductase [Eubacterium uniforme]SKA65759.1 3-oxoacyl-[acyl-carrier-protein] reductase [Eubacterium uniforme]
MSRKTAIVTGGSRGIGRAICLKLAKEGYDIAFSYRSKDDEANEVKSLLEEAGANVFIKKFDVSDSEECSAFVKETNEKFGDIDVLVNNAGITKDNLMIRLGDDDFSDVLDVNLKGSFYMAREVSKLMLRKRKGSIINMSSVVGIMGNAGQVNYSASKAGVIGMTKSLARELAKKNVRVNAVAPGMIETDMTDVLPEEAKKKIADAIPLKEMGKPEDIANAVVFLAGDNSRYITGQVLSVDGGMAI